MPALPPSAHSVAIFWWSDVRHSFASAALAAGEHPKVVQERLGHSTTTITLDVYSHVSREVEEAAAHRIAASILGGDPS